MAVLAPDHPLAAGAELRLADLADSPLILYPRQPAAFFSRFVEGLYRDAGLTPDVAHRADEIQTAIALVAAGLGVTYVGASVASLGRPDVAYKPLGGAAASQLTTLSATFRSDEQSAHLGALLAILGTV
jgi:DNA-binding transcriptional LysR family regulator